MQTRWERLICVPALKSTRHAQSNDPLPTVLATPSIIPATLTIMAIRVNPHVEEVLIVSSCAEAIFAIVAVLQ